MRRTISIGLFALATWAVVAWAALAQNVSTTVPAYTQVPGYVSGRFYSPIATSLSTSVAVGTLDTLIYLIPVTIQQESFAATSLGVRIVTGAVNCAVKLALWNHSATTKRATGTAIAGSNTGQACTATPTNVSVTISRTLPQGLYWFGAAFTTGAPNAFAIANLDSAIMAMTGRTSINANSSITALSAPYTYATDIMALDLTAATFTDVIGAQGVPLPYIGN